MLPSRRDFLASGLAGIAASGWAMHTPSLFAQTRDLPPPGDRPPAPPADVKVLNPRGRVPVSFIIDDSTCLANLSYFAIPQFAEVFPNQYRQDWRKLPREIPDDFVKKFGNWCGEQGVKGKYSIVPNPACVGRVDQRLPGWTRAELEASVKLVQDLMMPSWDIHPEMVTHTFVIDTKTGRPYDEHSPRFMENWEWSVNRSADELTDYLSYALQILKNAGLHCEGVTTPGGFGNRARPALSQATLDSCRNVFGVEIPHYFRDLDTGDRSVAPLVQRASGLDTENPKCVVSIIGCTGDWFGGWDGLERGSVDQFITADLKGGRLPQVIERGEPAILVCHWPGIYFNGEEVGFNIFKDVVARLHTRYDNLVWMKLSEIARYWAAKELTKIERKVDSVVLSAPYACPSFTVEVDSRGAEPSVKTPNGEKINLRESPSLLRVEAGMFVRQGNRTAICFDLAKGQNEIRC